MIRFGYFALLLVVIAGLTHLVSLLAIPAFAERDAWAKLSSAGKPWEFTRIASPGQVERPVTGLDPALHVAACRFDLREGAVRVTADGKLPFWSVSIFDRRGRNVYSFNDRTAVNRQLFLVVVDAVQMAQLRTAPADTIEQAVLIEAPIDEGFVLIRALEHDSSWKSRLDAFFGSARCERLDISDSENAQSSS